MATLIPYRDGDHAVGLVRRGQGSLVSSIHGGPGRAGGGEELGGQRALAFHHRRTAIQASLAVLAALPAATVR